MQQFRFIRRDGPRLFLDSRDLIALIEHSEPVTVAAFAETLGKRNGRIVLTYTNIAELVPQNEKISANPARVRRLLDELEQVPHIYMRIPEFTRDEFRAAIDAFERSEPVTRVDPFVDHFWETAWITPPWIARRIDPRSSVELRDRMTLAEQVAALIDDPRCLRFQPRHGAALTASISADRNALGTSRGSGKAFEGAIARRLSWYGWPEPRAGISAFSRFVRRTPEACPGWRSGYDVWEEFRCDLNCKPEVNDMRDMEHVEILPYVTHATLDRAWRSRCRQVRDRLNKANLWSKPFDRVYENVKQIFEAWRVSAD